MRGKALVAGLSGSAIGNRGSPLRDKPGAEIAAPRPCSG